MSGEQKIDFFVITLPDFVLWKNLCSDKYYLKQHTCINPAWVLRDNGLNSVSRSMKYSCQWTKLFPVADQPHKEVFIQNRTQNAPYHPNSGIRMWSIV